MRRFLLSFVFFLSLFSALPEKARADAVSVSPMFQEVMIEAGQEEPAVEVAVTNDTETLQVFRLSVVDFGTLDESGGVAFLGASGDLERKYGLASWLTLEKDALAVSPGETQGLKVTIENRESLSPGGHYAAVLFRIENPEGKAENGVAQVGVSQSLASLVFVKKTGGEITNLDLKGTEWRKNIFGFPVEAKLRFQNTGNVHVVPRGTVEVKDMLERTVAKGSINAESGIILPETFRQYVVTLQEIAQPLVPGPYTAFIHYRYDGKEEMSVQTERFFAGVGPSMAALLVVAGGSFLFTRYRKRERARQP